MKVQEAFLGIGMIHKVKYNFFTPTIKHVPAKDEDTKRKRIKVHSMYYIRHRRKIKRRT